MSKDRWVGAAFVRNFIALCPLSRDSYLERRTKGFLFMNGYQLTRQWFEWRFNNPGKLSSAHAELYFYIVDRWNYFGQKSEFGLPRMHTMEVLSIGSRNTYKKLFSDLIEHGFIKLIRESCNQYHHASIIALSKFEQAPDTPLDTPTEQAHEQPTEQAPDPIDKPINQLTNKPNTRQKQFVAPTYEQVKAYFLENRESLNELDRCYHHYADANWFNSRGKKVVNWKQTIKTNWFGKNQNSQNRNIPADPASRKVHESFNL